MGKVGREERHEDLLRCNGVVVVVVVVGVDWEYN
jgi:hypothetical protein